MTKKKVKDDEFEEFVRNNFFTAFYKVHLAIHIFPTHLIFITIFRYFKMSLKDEPTDF